MFRTDPGMNQKPEGVVAGQGQGIDVKNMNQNPVGKGNLIVNLGISQKARTRKRRMIEQGPVQTRVLTVAAVEAQILQ